MADVALELDLGGERRESAAVRWYRAHAGVVRGCLSLFIVGVIWELAGRTGRWPLILAPISDIWAKFAKLAVTGELTRHVLVSLDEFIVGFAIAAAFGICVGIAIATSDTVKDF